jgi:hypothetical protein
MEPKELQYSAHSLCYDTGLGIAGASIKGITTSSPNYTTEGISGYSITTGTVVSGTTTFNNSINFSTPPTNNKIMQSKVAVFKVTRDKDNKITDTEFIKELWVGTKNNQSVDFQVARDKDLADYDANDLIIKIIYTVTFQ